MFYPAVETYPYRTPAPTAGRPRRPPQTTSEPRRPTIGSRSLPRAKRSSLPTCPTASLRTSLESLARRGRRFRFARLSESTMLHESRDRIIDGRRGETARPSTRVAGQRLPGLRPLAPRASLLIPGPRSTRRACDRSRAADSQRLASGSCALATRALYRALAIELVAETLREETIARAPACREAERSGREAFGDGGCAVENECWGRLGVLGVFGERGSVVGSSGSAASGFWRAETLGSG